jgi:release factor glutamine methyltransferase
MNLKELKRYIESELLNIYDIKECESIASIIIEEKLSYSKSNIILNYRNIIENKDINEIDYILHRLKQNEPIQYILGNVEFYDLKFKVTNETLIPRQETELLVDKIISYNKDKTNLKILDIGTGSACIAISLAKNISNSKVTALDISDNAIDVAKENAIMNKVDVSFINEDLFKINNNLVNELDVIVSNPPYVTEKEKEFIHNNVLNFEPKEALFVSNENPLIFYNEIVSLAKNNLKNKGQLWLEINEAYGNEIKNLLEENNFSSVKIIKDYNKKQRFVFGLKKQ